MSAIDVLQSISPWLSLWGAVLASVLFAIKLWETFWKDRMRLATTYSFTTERGAPNEITIANLRPAPVQVISWKLVWEAAPLRWFTKAIDVTPDWDQISAFRIDGHSSHTIRIYDGSGFMWGGTVEDGRRLCLSLRVFGQRKKKKLIISSR